MRIVVVSHTGRETGFGRVAAGIAAALSSVAAVHVVGLGASRGSDAWVGHEHDERADPTRTNSLLSIVEALRPEAVVLSGVGVLLGWMTTLLRRSGFEGAVVAYVPVEGPITEPERLVRLGGADVVVAYTDTAAGALEAALAGTSATIRVVPHAVDALGRAAGPARGDVRARLFPGAQADPDAVWILNANRNDARKRPELTMRAFAAVADQHPASMLVLHCPPRRRDADLRVERARLGLEERVILTQEHGSVLWSPGQLVDLYACCDIGVNTATAEGWGLVAFEHALHGAAQVLPGHEGLRSIWGDAPAWVPLRERTHVDGVFAGAMPDVADLRRILDLLISDPLERRAVAVACATRAGDPALSWKVVGEAWRRIVVEAASSRETQKRPTFRPSASTTRRTSAAYPPKASTSSC